MFQTTESVHGPSRVHVGARFGCRTHHGRCLDSGRLLAMDLLDQPAHLRDDVPAPVAVSGCPQSSDRVHGRDPSRRLVWQPGDLGSDSDVAAGLGFWRGDVLLEFGAGDLPDHLRVLYVRGVHLLRRVPRQVSPDAAEDLPRDVQCGLLRGGIFPWNGKKTSFSLFLYCFDTEQKTLARSSSAGTITSHSTSNRRRAPPR